MSSVQGTSFPRSTVWGHFQRVSTGTFSKSFDRGGRFDQRIYTPRRHEEHEEKGDCGFAGLRRSYSHPWHAFFLVYCTQRRKDYWDASSILSCLHCRGNHSCRTLPSPFLSPFFFVLFVAFVVKHLVVDQGCARSIRGWQFPDPVFSREKGAGMAPFSLYFDPIGDSRYFRQPGAILSIF